MEERVSKPANGRENPRQHIDHRRRAVLIRRNLSGSYLWACSQGCAAWLLHHADGQEHPWYTWDFLDHRDMPSGLECAWCHCCGDLIYQPDMCAWHGDNCPDSAPTVALNADYPPPWKGGG